MSAIPTLRGAPLLSYFLSTCELRSSRVLSAERDIDRNSGKSVGKFKLTGGYHLLTSCLVSDPTIKALS